MTSETITEKEVRFVNQAIDSMKVEGDEILLEKLRVFLLANVLIIGNKLPVKLKHDFTTDEMIKIKDYIVSYVSHMFRFNEALVKNRANMKIEFNVQYAASTLKVLVKEPLGI